MNTDLFLFLFIDQSRCINVDLYSVQKEKTPLKPSDKCQNKAQDNTQWPQPSAEKTTEKTTPVATRFNGYLVSSHIHIAILY